LCTLGLFAIIFVLSIAYLDQREQQRWPTWDWEWQSKWPTLSKQKSFGNVIPSTHFRDSLSPSKKYITAFVSAGITNQIVSVLHLLELAKLTGRIPILPPFSPIHTSLLAGFIPFSEVFDIDRLEQTLGFQLLEWGGNPRTPSGYPAGGKYAHRNHIIKDTLGLNLPSIANLTNSPNSPSHEDIQRLAYSSLSSSSSTPAGWFTSFFLGAPDTLGCWSLMMTQRTDGFGPRHGDVTGALNLAVSWTPVPFGHQAQEGNFALDLEELAKFGQSGVGTAAAEAPREEAIRESKEQYLSRIAEVRSRMSEAQRKSIPQFTDVVPSRAKLEFVSPLWEAEPGKGWEEREGDAEGKQIEPDEQVLCFDYLYYSSFKNATSKSLADDSTERAFDTIGMDLRFSKRLLDITADILRTSIFNGPDFSHSFIYNSERDTNPFPPYIAVHARRNDFDAFCQGRDPTTCFTPLSTYASAVESIRSSLLSQNPSLRDKEIPVILFSDEPKHMNQWFQNRYHRPEGFSEQFWKDVDKLGWKSIDHADPTLVTEERWGFWYPILVDAAVMGHAVGYVGTSKSTFSLVGAKRVARWWNGPTMMVDAVVPMDS